ncbi:shikimate dehydrogenase [Pseudorhodobacter ferrugineus]|uniref:shikimate dehydrogenase n=1 Tax=Pseudorhodobacter ferrugineus TaxID=77008 RepID=UPI0003B5630C
MDLDIKLGLIGDNIAQSQAPRLHQLAGKITGLSVSYDRLVPRDMGLNFDGVFALARDQGFRGLNITYPYKKTAFACVSVPDPLVRAIGAVNTVVFEPDGPVGFNTDYTGFVAAYRKEMGQVTPGVVCMVGTGGAGRAVAFGLIALGAEGIRLMDLDRTKAETLATALRQASPKTEVVVFDNVDEAARGASGLINCTPIGMVGYDGTPMPAHVMQGAAWAFDAVYTPIDTRFLQDAKAAGLQVISGYELFFGQGIDAWHIFTNAPIDAAALRQALQ